MSKLKKNAEFYDGYMKRDEFIEVYINPTSSEFDKIKRSSDWGSVRMFLHLDGTVYAWISDISHDTMEKHFSIGSDCHLEAFDDELVVYLKPSIDSPEKLYDYLSKLNLSTYKLSLGTELAIDDKYYKSNHYDIYNEVKTIQDFFNYCNEENKEAN